MNRLDWHWRFAIIPRLIGGRWVVGWFQQRDNYFHAFRCDRRVAP